jgi:hypothetical protein
MVRSTVGSSTPRRILLINGTKEKAVPLFKTLRSIHALFPALKEFLGALEIEKQEGDVVLLVLTSWRASPVGNFGEEGVGERIGGQ